MTEYPNVTKYDTVAVDTETTGLKWWENKMFAFSLSTPDKNYYYDIRDNPMALEWAKDNLKKAKALVGHNIKFDMHFLREAGVDLRGPEIHDTMIRGAIINEKEPSVSLDNLSSKYLKAKKVDIGPILAGIFGGPKTKNVQMPRLQYLGRTWPVKPSLDDGRIFSDEMLWAAEYAMKDTALTLKLFEFQKPKIEEQSLSRVLDQEMRLLPVIIDMEYRGVKVDVERAVDAREALKKDMALLEKRLYELAGFVPNINAREQIWQLFNAKQDEKGNWYTMNGEFLPKTGTGEPSFSKAVLQNLVDEKAKIVLQLRAMDKLIGTFINGHILGSHHNGIVHTSFNQTRQESGLGTETGRLSSSGPNLQQIPKRDKTSASRIRPLFLPDEDQNWRCRDWDQMDFRVFAHYVNEKKINDMYEADPDTDFHQAVADLADIPRNAGADGGGNAKQINLGMVFGMGEGRMAKEMGLDHYMEEGYNGRSFLKAGDEAKKMFKKYHDMIPGVKRMKDKATSLARSRGFVMDIMGGRLRFPDTNTAYKAAGLIYQATAARCMKEKMIEVHNELKGTEGRLMLVVHDEFNLSIPKKDEELAERIGKVINDFGPDSAIYLRVPIGSDEGIGPNWWEASK